MPGPDPLTTEWVPIWNTTGPLYTVEDEGVALPIRTVLNFTGPGVVASDVGGKTTITITGTAPPVTSVFTRIGAVVAANGDYTAAQVTNAVSTLGSYADPSWIPSYAYSKLTGVPATFTPAAHVHAAADTTSGVFVVARLGTGTPSSSNYLRGDGAWTALPAPPTIPVTSVFTRTGAIVATAGDYTAALVTNAVSTLGSYADPAWITSLAYSKITGAPAPGAGQTPWLSNIEAAGFSLSGIPNIDFYYSGTRAGAISSFIFEGNGALEFYTYDATDGHLAIHAAVGGHVGIAGAASATHNLEVTGTLNLMGGPYYLNGVPLALGQPQTPWAQTINAAGFWLNNTSGITMPAEAGYEWWLASFTAVGPWQVIHRKISDSTWTAPFTILTTGLVGIGTATPAFALDVVGEIRTTGHINSGENLYVANTAGDAGVTYRLDGYADWLHLIAQPSAATGTGIRIMTGPAGGAIASRIEIMPGGAVGIGKVPGTHNSLLQVNGPLNAAQTPNAFIHLGADPNQGPSGDLNIGMYVDTTNLCGVIAAVSVAQAWRNIVLCPYAGNVGITNAAPAYRLDVAGSCNVTGGYYVNGVALTTGGQPQTPWAQQIDGANRGLYFPGTITMMSGTAIWFRPPDNSYHWVMYSPNASVVQIASGGGPVGFNMGSDGMVGIGTSFVPAHRLVVLPTVTITAYTASGLQMRVGESSNSGGYGTHVGFCYINSNWQGVIQAAPSCPLILNPAGGNIGIGNWAYVLSIQPTWTMPTNLVTIVANTNPASYARNAHQVLICEQSANPGYGLGIGFAPYTNGVYSGAIQAHHASTNGYLYLNPSGGNVCIAYGGAPQFGITCGLNSFGIQGATATVWYTIGVDMNTAPANWTYAGMYYHTGNNCLEIEARTTSTFARSMCLNPRGGSVGIGVPAPTYGLHLSSDGAAKQSTSTWQVWSDARLKRNIRDLEGGLDVIAQLRPIVAEFNGLASTPDGGRTVGFLAHEIREILPHTVGSVRYKLRPDDPEEVDILDFNLHEVLIHLVLAVKQLAKERELQ